MAHAESAKTSVLNTGLAIEIFDGDYGNDAQSVSFINDPNYPIYEELCRKYGFKIDKNIPWRMVANIKSNNLSPYILESFPLALNTFRPRDVFKQFFNERPHHKPEYSLALKKIQDSNYEKFMINFDLINKKNK